MPIYEYQCTKCNDRTEMIQKFTDPPYAVCDKCGGDVRKLMSAPAIQFKGSGFYKTDSRPSEKKSDAPKADAPKADAPKSDAPKPASTGESAA